MSKKISDVGDKTELAMPEGPSMGANLTIVTATVLEAIKKQTSQLQLVAIRVGDAEKQIAGVVDVATSSVLRVAFFEKQVHDMQEHFDNLDKRGRRCNILVAGIPESLTDKQLS